MSMLIFDQAYVGKEPVVELTPIMMENLIACAEALDEETTNALNSLLFDFLDRAFENESIEAADSL